LTEKISGKGRKEIKKMIGNTVIERMSAALERNWRAFLNFYLAKNRSSKMKDQFAVNRKIR
jgi:hypothetical protein